MPNAEIEATEEKQPEAAVECWMSAWGEAEEEEYERCVVCKEIRPAQPEYDCVLCNAYLCGMECGKEHPLRMKDANAKKPSAPQYLPLYCPPCYDRQCRVDTIGERVEGYLGYPVPKDDGLSSCWAAGAFLGPTHCY